MLHTVMWEINATKYFHAIFLKILLWECKSGEKEGELYDFPTMRAVPT